MILLALVAAASACVIHLWQQQTIINRLNTMPTESDLDAKIATLTTTVADLGTQLEGQFTALKKKLDDALANNQPQPDLSDEIASVDAAINALKGIGAAHAEAAPSAPVEEAPAPEAPAP